MDWCLLSSAQRNCDGKRGVTPDTALRLEQVFGVDAQCWLNLEVAWELYRAKHSKEAREIQRIRRHPALAAAAG